MKRYNVTGFGRKVGSIGLGARFSTTLESASADAARLDIYQHYEHITDLQVLEDVGWAAGMAAAYTAGLEDGKAGTAGHREAPGGFEACYWQGVGHGAGVCSCPERLRARWPDQRCPCCGCRRAPQAPVVGS